MFYILSTIMSVVVQIKAQGQRCFRKKLNCSKHYCGVVKLMKYKLPKFKLTLKKSVCLLFFQNAASGAMLRGCGSTMGN